MRTLLLFLLTFSLYAQEEPTSFREVARYLNPGGDFYLYLNSAQFAEKVTDFTKTIEDFVLLSQGPREREASRRAFQMVREILHESGLTQLKGMGMSSVLYRDGLYANRSVAYHGPEPVEGRLWQLGAGEPHAFSGLELMPANTVLGITGNFRLDLFWEYMTELLPKMDPNAEEGLADVRAQLRKRGNDLDAIMAAFSGEVTLVVTMNPEQQRQLAPDVTIPDLSVMIIAGVKDDQLYQAVARELADEPKGEKITLPDGAEGVTLPGGPGPMRFNPTVAKTANRVFFASNPQVIEAALMTDGNGLASTPAFQDLRKNLPEQGNQLLYLSPDFSAQVKRIIRDAIGDKLGPGGNAQVWAGKADQMPSLRVHGVPFDGPALLEKALAQPKKGADLHKTLADLPDYKACVVTAYHKDAVVSYSNESMTVGARMIVPALAMSLGVALPAMSARRAHQHQQQRGPNPQVLRQQGLGKLRRIGGAIMTMAAEDRENRELPESLAAIAATGKLPPTAEVWDCPGTPRKTWKVADTDYVYLGAKMIDWAAQADSRVIAHSPAGAYDNSWVNFLFLDGHVETQHGNDPKAIAKARGWIYGVREGEGAAQKPPEDFHFKLEEGKLVLLDAADEREVGRSHPADAFDKQDLSITCIAAWDKLCWVGTSGGLFRFDAQARSWSRFAIERTHLDVPVDSLTIDGDLLQVGYAAKSATFNLKERTWLSAAVAPAVAEEDAAQEPAPGAGPPVSVLEQSKTSAAILIVLLGITAVVLLKRKTAI